MSNNQGATPKVGWVSWVLRRLLAGIGITLVAGALVMILWNAIIPQIIDGAHALSFLQAVGLLVLSRLLFYSGWLTQGSPASTSRRGMPPEDRAAFLARVRQRLAEAEVDRTGSWSSGGREQ